MTISAVYLVVDGSEIIDLSPHSRSMMLIPLLSIVDSRQVRFCVDGDTYLRAHARYSGIGKGGRSVVQKGFTPWEISHIVIDSEPEVLNKVTKMVTERKIGTCITPAILKGNFGSIDVLIQVDQLSDLCRRLNYESVHDKKTSGTSKTDKSG